VAAITPDLVAEYRDERLEAGKSASTVRPRQIERSFEENTWCI
jgi:hypothetical protein